MNNEVPEMQTSDSYATFYSGAKVGSDEDWKQRAIWLQYELRKRGYTQAAFAKLIGVSHSTVNNVLHGRATSHPVAEKVAELLGRPMQELFPDRYIYRPRKR